MKTHSHHSTAPIPPSIGAYFNYGWQIFSKKAGLMLGYFFVTWLMYIGTFLLTMPISIALAQLSPLVMALGVMLMAAAVVIVWLCLINGNYLIAAGIDQGEPVSIRTGFGALKKWGPLLGGNFLKGLIAYSPYLIGFGIWIIQYGEIMQQEILALKSDSISDPVEAMSTVFSFYGTILGSLFTHVPFLIGLVITGYLSVAFSLTNAYILVGNRTAVDALKSSFRLVNAHFGSVFGTFILLGFIVLASFLVPLGTFVIMPFTNCLLYGIYAVHEQPKGAYEEMLDEFGDPSETDF
ncbi:hypothetical protein [Pontibacter sp. G13]|uniref:hypothetical protein n=1 Tax=Pontibacter sp. G13 TaxID=3074898 RepID=UPI002889685E|nr:hypothetical protein [Pontibacter sp. G13]WNJ19865.1 hypothetical protein RJD25_05225 [Pontibacter sp. G13]